jgi:hypothetical protein
MSNPLPAATAIVVLLAACADAGESPTDKAARERAKAVLSRCKACDESLLGTTWMGIYVRGWRNVGTIRMDVRKGAEGAAYEVAVTTRHTIRGQTGTRIEEMKLDPTFALLSRTQSEEQGGRKSSMTLLLQKDTWECTWTFLNKEGKEEPPIRFEQKTADKDHGWDPALFLLCRKLDLKKPNDYLLRGTTWPIPAEKAGEEPKGSAGVRNVRLTVPARATYTHRGKVVPGFEIRLEKEGDRAAKILVDESGRLLRTGDFAGEVSCIVGTEQEASSNLPAGNEKEGAAGAKAALRLYFRVLAKSEDVDALDEVVDWAAYREEVAKEDAEMAGLDAKAYAEREKSVLLSREAVFTVEEAEEIAQFFKADIQGDTAAMSAEGLQWKPVLLKRIDGKWKIVKPLR